MSADKPAKRGPQWNNSFEAQLSDAQLQRLHGELLARVPHSDILQWLPKWKSGKRMGQPVSLGTLSHIFDRLEMEEGNTEDAATTESILEELKQETPSLTQQQVDEFGNRIFSLLTIRKRNLDGFVTLQSARTKAQLEREKLELRKQELSLNREKFRALLQTKVEAGIDALAEELKNDPAALAVLAKARERAAKAMA